MNIGKVGSDGEKTAINYLKKHKYKILSQNYQTYFGEIDIVCKIDNYIVFVEVKTRSDNYMVSGIYSGYDESGLAVFEPKGNGKYKL